MQDIYELPIEMQIGVYEDFSDSLGIDYKINKKDGYFYKSLYRLLDKLSKWLKKNK